VHHARMELRDHYAHTVGIIPVSIVPTPRFLCIRGRVLACISLRSFCQAWKPIRIIGRITMDAALGLRFV
jgi:hypothetical protein